MQLSANQEPHPPPASTPDVEDNGPIIKDSLKNVKKPFLSKEVFLEDSEGNVVKI